MGKTVRSITTEGNNWRKWGEIGVREWSPQLREKDYNEMTTALGMDTSSMTGCMFALKTAVKH